MAGCALTGPDDSHVAQTRRKMQTPSFLETSLAASPALRYASIFPNLIAGAGTRPGNARRWRHWARLGDGQQAARHRFVPPNFMNRRDDPPPLRRADRSGAYSGTIDAKYRWSSPSLSPVFRSVNHNARFTAAWMFCYLEKKHFGGMK